MPNYCKTKYVIEAEKAQIDNLEKMMTRLQMRKEKDSPLVTNWGACWLGFIIMELGMDYNDYHCRGIWQDMMRLSDEALAFTTVTTWRAPHDMEPLLCDSYGGTIYYYEEEPGCEIFNTNDREGRFFAQRYWMYLWLIDDPADFDSDMLETEETFVTLDDAFIRINELTSRQVSSMKEVEALCLELEQQEKGGMYITPIKVE